jgi:hypothetical protein
MIYITAILVGLISVPSPLADVEPVKVWVCDKFVDSVCNRPLLYSTYGFPKNPLYKFEPISAPPRSAATFD